MRRAVVAEIVKLTTARSVWALAAVIAGVGAVVAIGMLGVAATTAGGFEGASLERLGVFGVFPILGPFAMVLGIRAFTDEFRYGTITPSVLAVPRRGRLVIAKVAGSALVAAVTGISAAAATVAVGAIAIAATPLDVSGAPGDVAVVAAAMTAAMAMYAMLGVGIGAAVRHQLTAVVVPLLWFLVIEPQALARVLGEAAAFLPGVAAHAIVDPSVAAFGRPGGAAVFAVYVLALVAIGIAAMRRRDIT